MQSSFDNRKRVFSEVISLEAWQQPTEPAGHTNLHVDIAFSEGRIGGEPDSKVRFRMSVKRAELVVVLPNNEPVSVLRSSVARETSEVQGTRSTRQTTGVSANAAAKLSTEYPVISLRSSLEASAISKKEIEVEQKQNFGAISVEQSMTSEGFYRWSMFGNIEGGLRGKPWDSIQQPRLVLIDTRHDRNKGISPVIAVRIRCLREDIQISDIALKNQGHWNSISSSIFFSNKIIAAEAYIRKRLLGEGLSSGDISDPFCNIDLAYMSVEVS